MYSQHSNLDKIAHVIKASNTLPFFSQIWLIHCRYYIINMTKNLLNDLKAGCRALDLVLRESIKHHHNTLDRIVDNSSVRAAVKDMFRNCRECIQSITTEDVSRSLNESIERASMVPQSLKVYVTTSHCKHKYQVNVSSVWKYSNQSSFAFSLLINFCFQYKPSQIVNLS